jgi:DNA-directed RNA polymerase specialized sigma24 family protein
VFLAMLPKIHRYAETAFRDLQGDNRDDAIQEVVANACVAFARLVQQGRMEKAFPTVLARFAIAQVRAGRQVGASWSVRDVLSRHAQRNKGFAVERLDRMGRDDEGWIEAVIEDPHTPVFEQVWFRIDFHEWLSLLSFRNRQIAETLAVGHSTQQAAKRFGISPARVSQLRRELYDSWQRFHGELIPPTPDTKNRHGSLRR